MILVTGGTGFLGVNLIRTLVATGQRVRALIRPTSRRLGLESPGIEFVTGDVTDIESIRRAMAGCDRVYHLAGWVQISPWGMDTARAVNVAGTDNICRVALERKVKRVVHTSSIAAVGHGPIDAPATETTAWNFHDLRSPYHVTKREAEQVVHRYVDRGLDAVIVNPSYVVGPYDVGPSSGRTILLLVTRKLRGFPAEGGIGFVDVREVVEGMRLAMGKGRCGERYILSNENMTYGQYARRVAEIGGVQPPRWALPFWMLYPPARLATTAENVASAVRTMLRLATVTGKRRVRCADHAPPCGPSSRSRFAQRTLAASADFNVTVLRTCFCQHYVCAEKARRELGVKPWPIDRAIADALAWFEKHGYVTRTAKGWRAAPAGRLPN